MGGPLGTGSCTSPVHPHSGAALGRPSGAQRCVRDTRVPNRRRRVYVGVMKAKAKTPPPLGGQAAAGAPTNSSLPGRLPLCGWWRCGLPHSRDPRLRNGGGRPPQRRPLPPRLKCAGAWCGRAGVTEARGPIGPRHRWSLWIVGRWPVLIPRFPGGAAPREPPFVGVSAGPDPSPEARMPQATQRPQGRTGGTPCVRTGV